VSTFKLHPRLAEDCLPIKDLELCRLLLMNDKNYPWCVLVPMREDKKDMYELTVPEQNQLMVESTRLSRAMMNLFRGTKMNVAALGNVVPQLHLHHIVRKNDDPCWPRPVWGQVPPLWYSDAEAQTLVDRIGAAL